MTDFLKKMYNDSLEKNKIDSSLYDLYNVKVGLRNDNGTGVLVGLTKISEVHGYNIENGKKIDDDGHLYYRGYDLVDICKRNKTRFGYESVAFLILFGRMPNEEELLTFHNQISKSYDLPDGFMKDYLLKNPSENLMNQIQKAVLSLYSFDDNPDDTHTLEILKKGVDLMGKMPAIINYSYQAKNHFINRESLVIRHPRLDFTIAENILYLLKGEDGYTKEDVDCLDLSLIIHADHGVANNSTFTDVVISSTGTDIYSSICGSLGALKGPRHGGANKEVMNMMNTVITEIGLDASDDEIRAIVKRLLNKDYYNNSGLIYGIGHAVYTISDPRAYLLKEQCRSLSKSKKMDSLFSFYERFEKISIEELVLRKGENFHCCANLDYYSGLAYTFLGIPVDLYTPIFATARLVGWLAHDIESKLYSNKIIRPAGKYVGEIKSFDE